VPEPFGYVFEPGNAISARDLFVTLRAAVDERVAVVWPGSDEVESYMPGVGAPALALSDTSPGNSVVHAGWSQAQLAMWAAASFFVQALPFEGGDEFTDPAQYAVFGQGTAGPAIGHKSEFPVELPDWPPPKGFTRRYPREITTVTAEGEEGQVARFVASLGTDLGEITPEAERANSGKLFRRRKVVVSPEGVEPPVTELRWAEDAEAAGPDVLEAFGTRQAGDYAGVWIPNETRDAARRLRWTFHPVEWTAPREEVIETFSSGTAGSNLFYAANMPEWDTIWAALLGEVASRWGSNGGEVVFLGGFDPGWPLGPQEVYGGFEAKARSVADAPDVLAPGNPRALSTTSDYVLSVNIVRGRLGRSILSSHAYPRVALPLVRRTKTVEWVVGGYYAAPGDPDYAYDDFGHGFPNAGVRAFAASSHQGGDAVGPKMGDAGEMPPVDTPGWFARGYVGYCGAVIKWNVEGGFEHK
jgi:hypothetical protein